MNEVEIEKPNIDSQECKTLNKIEDLMVYAEAVLLRFPKYTRFTRVADITRCMDQMMEICVEAEKHYYKKTTLQQLDCEVEKLRRYVRISHRLRYISDGTYRLWSEKVDEIGRMVGGWIKAAGGAENKKK